MMFFFDLDGPILDVSEKYYQAYSYSLQELNCTALPKDDYWKFKRLRVPDYEILSKTDSEHLLAEYKTRRNELIEKKEMLAYDCVWTELRKTYDSLFNEFPAILVTLRTEPEMVNWQLRDLNIDTWFKSIISRPSTGISKDRWKIKVDAIKALDLSKSIDIQECVFVGDTETDIVAGKQLGMKTVGVTFGIRDKKLLSPLKPEILVDNPSDLAVHLKETYL
ncbi:HAD hydrolase-like protein [Methanolobus sp. ZRKC2]|uniref:HAD family hydrolase n=1 Tax=Methanolobus sp. ZRKC2 TaxID=3125783 RepID=UPI003249361F